MINLLDELDIIKTHDSWPARIDAAIACAYQDSDHGRNNYIELKHKYILYILDKMMEEHYNNISPVNSAG